MGNYKFSYAVSNNDGDHFRKEGTDDLGRVIGTYGLTHNDGTHRVVEYIADKDGFRAEVRSNEPGVASAEVASASIVKLAPDLPLATAASSVDKSGRAFGTRLRSDSSRVTYISQEESKAPEQERIDSSPRESRHRSFDDYRPRSPVAYYPGSSSSIDSARPLSPPAYSSADVPERSRSQNPSVESRPLDIYLPPINPHTAVRRLPYNPRTTDESLYTSTSRRPFTPPYGGFDDDPLPIGRHPGVSMSTVHGGYGANDIPQTSTPVYGAGRYPSEDSLLPPGFVRSRFPPNSNFPTFPRQPGSLRPSVPRNDLPPGSRAFGPPSFATGPRSPNFVLRAVPIPNGIQAVRIDPETGRIYERLMYPLYLRQDGQAVYDRNILLHNDDVSDDDAVRNDNPGYLDIPFRRRPPFRFARNPPLDFNGQILNRSRQFNGSFVDPLTFSIPTARDLALVHRQLAMVEGYDRSRFPNPSVYRENPIPDNEYRAFNDFDDFLGENIDNDDRSYSRIPDSDRSADREHPRSLRLIDRLTPEDTKEIVVSKAHASESDPKAEESNPEPSAVEKE